MVSALYTILNPIMKGLLRSPLHGMVSGSIAVLEFTGRVSGKSMSTPVSYLVHEGRVHLFTSQDATWWRNLIDAPEIALLVGGKRLVGPPRVVVDDDVEKQAALTMFLTALPRDATFSNVGLDDDKKPIAEDVARAVPEMVYISMPA
jgi:deazaflavin-dependent oxidoreductase (nitroreductase family)